MTAVAIGEMRGVRSGNSLRLWILGCAVGCFAAGVGAGFALPDLVRAAGRTDGAVDPDEQYVQQMTADFGLTGSQQHQLRIVMQRYKDEELLVYRGAKFDQLPPSLQSELTAARRRWSGRIRALLAPEQQHRFDEKARAAGR